MTKITPAVNDKNSIVECDVDKIVRHLCVSYAQIRIEFARNIRLINLALDQNDVTTVIKIMRRVFDLPSGFVKKVGYSAKIEAIAMLRIEYHPVSGLPLQSTMYFQKSCVELCKMPRYRLLHVIGHELSHARMHIDNHKYRPSEFATDVLSLIATGSSVDYVKHMREQTADYILEYGYIRTDLFDALFCSLDKYASVAYLK